MFDPAMFDPVMFETGEAAAPEQPYAGGQALYKVTPERWG